MDEIAPKDFEDPRSDSCDPRYRCSLEIFGKPLNGAPSIPERSITERSHAKNTIILSLLSFREDIRGRYPRDKKLDSYRFEFHSAICDAISI